MTEKRRSSPPRHHREPDDDGGEAFVADAVREPTRLPEDAEEFAQEFVASATSAEEVFTDANDEVTVEELGGPYLEIDGKDEPTWFSSDSIEEEEED